MPPTVSVEPLPAAARAQLAAMEAIIADVTGQEARAALLQPRSEFST